MNINKNQPTQKYSSLTIRAVIGLGNPGSKYYKTRHSIGFRVIDALANLCGGVWQQGPKQEYAEVRLSTDRYDISSPLVYLIKPLTFMNNSGEVLSFLQKKGIKPEEIVVIHDELEKPFEHVSLHFGGGAKGHNGLRSIMNMIGKDFWKLRFGVGRPDDREDVGDFVLTPFSLKEESEIPQLLDKAVSLILKR